MADFFILVMAPGIKSAEDLKCYTPFKQKFLKLLNDARKIAENSRKHSPLPGPITLTPFEFYIEGQTAELMSKEQLRKISYETMRLLVDFGVLDPHISKASTIDNARFIFRLFQTGNEESKEVYYIYDPGEPEGSKDPYYDRYTKETNLTNLPVSDDSYLLARLEESMLNPGLRRLLEANIKP